MTLLTVKEMGLFDFQSVFPYHTKIKDCFAIGALLQQPKQQIWILETWCYGASLPNPSINGTDNHWESLGVLLDRTEAEHLPGFSLLIKFYQVLDVNSEQRNLYSITACLTDS